MTPLLPVNFNINAKVQSEKLTLQTRNVAL